MSIIPALTMYCIFVALCLQKQNVMRYTINGEFSKKCPTSLLLKHQNATLYTESIVEAEYFNLIRYKRSCKYAIVGHAIRKTQGVSR